MSRNWGSKKNPSASATAQRGRVGMKSLRTEGPVISVRQHSFKKWKLLRFEIRYFLLEIRYFLLEIG